MISCSTTGNSFNYNDGMGIYPVKDIKVTTTDDLSSGLFEILGSVKGSASAVISDPNILDENKYTMLTPDVIYQLDLEVAHLNPNSSIFELLLVAAYNDLATNANKLEASFVIFPNYTVSYDEANYELTITVNATAVKVVKGIPSRR